VRRPDFWGRQRAERESSCGWWRMLVHLGSGYGDGGGWLGK